jgi:cytochrome d ubiquinol oxidase subunit II
LFWIGSLMAAMAQGWMLGSYLTGFDYGVWSLLFALGIAVTLPTAYCMLGAGWLIMKTADGLQLKAVAWARTAFVADGLALVGISLATPMVSQNVFDRWFAMPQIIGLLPIPVACAVAFFAALQVVSKPRAIAAGYGWVVFASTVLIFVLSFLGLAYSIYPTSSWTASPSGRPPPRMSRWSSSSSASPSRCPPSSSTRSSCTGCSGAGQRAQLRLVDE